MENEPYEYEPLDVTRNEIRIIALHRSTTEQDPIHCNLLHVSLDDEYLDFSRETMHLKMAKTFFGMLSYTWGSSDRTGLIRINKQHFPVTRNIEAALRYLRKYEAKIKPDAITPSYWWVDAICIYQEDLEERNQQVTLMTRIFTEGWTVHIWLGVEANDSAMAMDLITKLEADFQRGAGEPGIEYSEVSDAQKLRQWNALEALYERSWWTRVWVRQELALPKYSIVHCGDQTCSLTAVERAAKILDALKEQFRFTQVKHVPKLNPLDTSPKGYKISCYRQAYLLARLRTQKFFQIVDLREMLFHSRTCKATDVRDKSIRETLVTTTRILISKTQNLDVLSGAQNPERHNGLPSWVLNLIDEWKAWPFEIEWNRKPNKKADFLFEGEDNSILRIKGQHLDCIATLADEVPQQDHSAEHLDVIFANWKAFAATGLSNPRMDKWDKDYLEQSLGTDSEKHWIKLLSREKFLLQKQTSIDSIMDASMANALFLLESETAIESRPHSTICKHLHTGGVGRKPCLSEKGTIALVPADARKGDAICRFVGATHAYVLRWIDTEESYVLVGEACEWLSPFTATCNIPLNRPF